MYMYIYKYITKNDGKKINENLKRPYIYTYIYIHTYIYIYNIYI